MNSPYEMLLCTAKTTKTDVNISYFIKQDYTVYMDIQYAPI